MTDYRVKIHHRRSARRQAAGFTLVELLAVMAIIAILSSIFLGALSQAQRASKVARTKSLISKMHNMLMARWDAYRTLRLPINAEAKGSGTDANYVNASNEMSRFRQNVARRRMFAIRELLRMEMPDRYSDLDDAQNHFTDQPFVPVVMVQPPPLNAPIRPYLWNAYRRKIIEGQSNYSIRTGKNVSPSEYWSLISQEYQSAECLYMILTSGIDDSAVASEHFRAGDAGDKDFDGMPEFRDAWGNPIEFLRWAPGLVSAAQPLYSYPKSDPRGALFHPSQPTDPNASNSVLSHWILKFNVTGTGAGASTKLVVIDQDDPFNPLRVGPKQDPNPVTTGNSAHMPGYSRWQPGDPPPEFGYMLTPLIYSYGLDMQSGIDHCLGYAIDWSPSNGALPPGVQYSDPYNTYQGPYGSLNRGSPKLRAAGVVDGYHYDNIHNHDLIRR